MSQLKYVLSAVALWIIVAVASPAGAEPCPESAQIFWKTFRTRALTKDPALLLAYVRFPFEVRGNLDDSAQRDLDRNAFLSSYSLLLATDPGMSPEPTSMESVLKKTIRVPKNACDEAGTRLRVGTWTFDLTPEGWKFVRAFVED